MSSKLIPKDPSKVMVIRHVTPNIVTFSVPFARAGILKVGGRGTVVRLTSGALAVFSPVALTTEARAKLAELGGEVKYIIAPDVEHHIFISEWAREFPNAHLICPEGLPEKRAKVHDDERIGKEKFNTVFHAKTKSTQTVTPEFDADFAYELVDAHLNKELVFCFRPEGVLIQADLLFCLPATEQYSRVPEAEKKSGLLARWIEGLMSVQGDAKGNKRFMWYLVSRRDRAGWNDSVRRIDRWDFNTIIPCHGDVIEGNGKDVYRKMMEWHLESKKHS